MSDHLKEHPLYQSLSPLKKELLEELTQSTEALSLDKALPLLLKANTRLKQNNEFFTKEESAFLITELTRQLTPQEKKKVATLLKML